MQRALVGASAGAGDRGRAVCIIRRRGAVSAMAVEHAALAAGGGLWQAPQRRALPMPVRQGALGHFLNDGGRVAGEGFRGRGSVGALLLRASSCAVGRIVDLT